MTFKKIRFNSVGLKNLGKWSMQETWRTLRTKNWLESMWKIIRCVSSFSSFHHLRFWSPFVFHHSQFPPSPSSILSLLHLWKMQARQMMGFWTLTPAISLLHLLRVATLDVLKLLGKYSILVERIHTYTNRMFWNFAFTGVIRLEKFARLSFHGK